MINPGEIYMAQFPTVPAHPVVVVSREELNRGRTVVAAIITSAKVALRSTLANCVPLRAGQFAMTKDCVVQGETVFNAEATDLDLSAGPIGTLDDVTMREVIRAIRCMMDSDCAPN